MSLAKYNFDNNLIKASYNKNINDAKREWYIITNKNIEHPCLCICQHKVKNITYMYNPVTKLSIIVGNKCIKKFEMNNNLLSNNSLKQILSVNLIKGKYEIINNIVKYSNNIEEQLIQYFKSEINKYTDNINKLKNINNEIKELINNYKLNYLEKIYEILNNIIYKFDIHKELNNKFLIYKVISYTLNYLPGQGRDIYIHENKFKSLEDCNDYISSLQLGITKYSGYGFGRKENTIEKIEILYHNNIIKIYINENKFKSLEDCNDYISLLETYKY